MARPKQQILTYAQLTAIRMKLANPKVTNGEIARKARVSSESVRKWFMPDAFVKACLLRFRDTGRLFPAPKFASPEEQTAFNRDMQTLRRINRVTARFGPNAQAFKNDFEAAAARWRKLADLACAGLDVDDLDGDTEQPQEDVADRQWREARGRERH